MAGKLKGFSPAQTREMWTKPSLDGWLEYFNEKAPDREWAKQGTSIVGKCLWHADTNPSMQFTPGKRSVFCFACQTGRFSLFDFLPELFKQPLDEVFFDFAQRFNVKTDADILEQIQYESRIQRFKKEFVLIASKALQLAANDVEGYAYGAPAVSYLQQRGVDIQQAYSTHIGIFPTRGQLFAELSRESKGVIDEYLGDVLLDNPMVTGPYGGRLTFPYYVTPQRIGRIKLKPPERGKNPIWLGTDKKATRGFFGLQMFPTIIGNGQETHHSSVVIVEGEMDQLSLAQEQVKNHPNEQIPIVCASGGGVEDISMLTDCGIRDYTLFPDNDDGGRSFVERIMSEASQDKLRRLSIVEWPDVLEDYKDPDEAIQSGDYLEVRDAIREPVNLREPYQWAIKHVSEKFSASRAMTTEQKVDLARKYGSLLKSAVQYDMFKDDAARVLGLRVALLDKHVLDISTDTGFMSALQRQIGNTMIPITFSARKLNVFNVKTKRLVEVPLSPSRAMRMAIQSILGMPMFDWVRHTTGIPDWIATKTTKQGTYPVELEKQMDMVDKYFERALEVHVASARPETDAYVKRQGIHYVSARDAGARTELDPGESPERFYVVNGEHMFKGERKRTRIQWERLEVPKHGAFLFEPDVSKRWTDHILDPNDLTPSSLESAETLFPIIREPLTTWSFLAGEIETYMLAAYIMVAPIMTCFPSLPMLFFTAPSKSGKSTFMQGILSSNMYPRITMLEPAEGADDYTAAYMQQKSAGSTFVRIWDEFEDPSYAKGSKAKEMDKALTTIRNISTGAIRGRGTQTGSSRQVEVRYPLIAGGVHPMQRDVDANRFVTIEMRHTPGHVAPDVALLQRYGADYFERIRRWTTLAGVQALPQLMDLYTKIEGEFLRENNPTIIAESTRMVRNCIVMAVGLAWANQPYTEIVQEYVRIQERRLAASSVTPEEALFRAVFQTNAIQMENHMVRHSLIKCLSDVNLRNALVNVDVGAYVPLQKNFVILYPDKLTTILRNNPKFRTMTSTSQIYQFLSRHPLVKNDPRFLATQPDVLVDLQRYIARPNLEELLVVHFSDLDFSNADPVNVVGLDPNEDM